MVPVRLLIRGFRQFVMAAVVAAGIAPVAIAGQWQHQSPNWSVWERAAQPGKSSGSLLILFPGYSVQRTWAEQWAQALMASPAAQEVIAVWVFAGPETVFYETRTLPTQTSLARLRESREYERILVVAHSSGSFPAHLWLNQLASISPLAKRYEGRIDYVNLDGGSGEGLAGGDLSLGGAALSLAGRWFAVSARDSATGSFSANHADMLALAQTHPGKITHRELQVDSGCGTGAEWCLHDALINRRPHDSGTFDLERDYTIFGPDHPVNTDWWPDASSH